MRNAMRWICPLVVFGWIFGFSATALAQVNPQIQKDIQQRVAHLQATQAAMDGSQADLDAAKKDLAAAQTFDEQEPLRSRMSKDRSDIEDDTSKILDDINYLQSVWDFLIPQQRSILDAAQKGLSQ